jgi:uncharacterized membrane protein YtjA (UPF0391 family)
MLGWALLFLIISVVSGIFGFGGAVSASMGIAQVLFFLFLVAFLIAIVLHLVHDQTPPPYL